VIPRSRSHDVVRQPVPLSGARPPCI
jgi:hypothetical protein